MSGDTTPNSAETPENSTPFVVRIEGPCSFVHGVSVGFLWGNQNDPSQPANTPSIRIMVEFVPIKSKRVKKKP